MPVVGPPSFYGISALPLPARGLSDETSSLSPETRRAPMLGGGGAPYPLAIPSAVGKSNERFP